MAKPTHRQDPAEIARRDTGFFYVAKKNARTMTEKFHGSRNRTTPRCASTWNSRKARSNRSALGRSEAPFATKRLP